MTPVAAHSNIKESNVVCLKRKWKDFDIGFFKFVKALDCDMV